MTDPEPHDEQEGAAAVAEQLRDMSRSLRNTDDEIDTDALAGELDRLATFVGTGARWECQVQSPFAEIYAVGLKDHGSLVYLCRHPEPHTFTG